MSNVFIATVGSNPLPIYVVMKLFLRDEQENQTDKEIVKDQFVLIASAEDKSTDGTTKHYAENIKNLLMEEFNEKVNLGNRIQINNISKNDVHNQDKIVRKIEEMKKLITQADKVWVLFSGGTKAMAAFTTETVVKMRNKKITNLLHLEPDSKLVLHATACMDNCIPAKIKIDNEVSKFNIHNAESLNYLSGNGKLVINRVNTIIKLYGFVINENNGKNQITGRKKEIIDNIYSKINNYSYMCMKEGIIINDNEEKYGNIDVVLLVGYQLYFIQIHKLKLNENDKENNEGKFVSNKKDIKHLCFKTIFQAKQLAGMQAKVILILYKNTKEGISSGNIENAKQIIRDEIKSFDTVNNCRVYLEDDLDECFTSIKREAVG